MTRSLLIALAALLACTSTDRTREPAAETWSVVDRRTELLDALAQAGSRRVLVDVSARWCVPCTELRRLTFGDGRVQEALADYATIEIDVSEESAEQVALGSFFGASALPCVLRFDDARTLHEALASGRRTAPLPSLRLHMFVAPDELLAALQR